MSTLRTRKRVPRPAALLGLLLLLPLALWPPGGIARAQTGGPYGLTWNSLDAGGGMFSTGGSYTLGGTIGQPDAGAGLSGGTYGLTGGFWQLAPARPLAVSDLRASGGAGAVCIEWTPVTQDVEGHAISGVTYEVHRGVDAPYFTPAAPYDTVDTAWTCDPGVLGDAAHSYAYLVRAVYAGLVSTDSNRVGAFAFTLTPGSP